ncbi:MAG: chemotaxis protein CheW [Usitatibacter sp.]
MGRHEASAEREEFLSFRLGAEEYAIDILQVREIRAQDPVTRIAGAPAFIRGVINLRGQIVPIVDLRVKLGHDAGYGALTVVIILNIAERPMGIVVDAVSDVVALLPGEIRPAPEMSLSLDAGFIRGLAPLDERMLIVMDIARLMTSRDMALVAQAAA